MKEEFYIVYAPSSYSPGCPSYLQLVSGGRMIQSSLYDASKFCSRERAEDEMKTASEVFKDKEFDVIPVDRRIFGDKPRWVE